MEAIAIWIIAVIVVLAIVFLYAFSLVNALLSELNMALLAIVAVVARKETILRSARAYILQVA